MTGFDVLGCEPVNPVEQDKVDRIYNSILSDGWHGCPILVYGNCLLTGSHRQAALKRMYDEDMGLSFECAEDVSDLLEGFTSEEIFENSDNLEYLFAGTWVEEYKEELEEW